MIAEFDGNLTCKRTDTVTVVHHQGKFRGPDFTPLHFTLEGQTAARLKDSQRAADLERVRQAGERAGSREYLEGHGSRLGGRHGGDTR